MILKALEDIAREIEVAAQKLELITKVISEREISGAMAAPMATWEDYLSGSDYEFIGHPEESFSVEPEKRVYERVTRDNESEP